METFHNLLIWIADNQAAMLGAIGTIGIVLASLVGTAAQAYLTWKRLTSTKQALDVTTSSIQRFKRTTPGTPGSADDVKDRVNVVAANVYPPETKEAIDASIARIPETEAKITAENLPIPGRLK